MLIVLSAVMLPALNGRIAGIVGRLMQGRQVLTGTAFVIGLILAALIYPAVFGAAPAVTMTVSTPLVVAAGLLVGFGTRMGSGCTGGHGVLGLARLSRRSIAAVATLLATGILTVARGGSSTFVIGRLYPNYRSTRDDSCFKTDRNVVRERNSCPICHDAQLEA